MSIADLETGFRFHHPEVLVLLGLIPLIIIAAVLKLRRRPNRFVLPVAHLVGTAPLKRRRGIMRGGPILMRSVAFGLLALAAAQPQWGEGHEKITAEGIEIALVLDLSGSMNAEDFYPSRVEAAKEVVREFVDGLEADRVALVVFSGTAMTQCPMTLDYDVVKGFLDYIDTHTVSQPGTNIGAAVMSGINKFDFEDGAVDKVMVLLTDGENNIEDLVDPVNAAKIANRKGIKIYTIGVGTLEGAPVPTGRGIGPKYAMDRWGRVQTSKLDEDTLIEIAIATGGRYFHASSEKKLSEIYSEISRMEKTEVEREVYVDYREMFQYFLLAGVIILLMEVVLSNTRLRVLP
jgi:Ca-activated chloride channel family protein